MCAQYIMYNSATQHTHPYFDKSTTLDQRSVRIQVFHRGVHFVVTAREASRSTKRTGFLAPFPLAIAHAQKNLIVMTLYYISNILHKRLHIASHVKYSRRVLTRICFSRIPFTSFYLRS